MWQDKAFEELPILIAEDSTEDLQLLQQALGKTSVQNPRAYTRTGEGTIDFLQAALDGPDDAFPVVLFLDLLMPRGSGLDVLHWLGSTPHPPLSIVLHTGVDDEEHLAQARELGAQFYLPKGARPEAIAEVFHRVRAEWEQQHMLVH